MKRLALRSGLAGCGLSLVLLAAAPAQTAAANAWDGAAFSATPEALRAAAGKVPPGDASAVVLFEETRWGIGSNGGATRTHRLVVRIDDDSGVEDWSSLESSWAPWHQKRPTLRARVVTAEGVEHRLDPGTIAEEPVADGSMDIYSDRRRVRAPLPAVARGAIIEWETIETDEAPLFEGGVVHTFLIRRDVPVRRLRLVVESPGPSEPRRVLRNAALTERVETTAGGRRLVLEGGPFEAADEEWEFDTPSDQPQHSYFAFATGDAWRKVAAGYAQIVERQIVGADLKAAVREATAGATGRREIAARLLAWLQKRIRYTGVEFAEASIVPRPPAEVLRRKYGDCKDKAAMLVALLREAGVSARVALLSVGPGHDVEPELPGLGAFDHAIVRVDGEPSLWIDPTDELARVGELPEPDQDRLALVAMPESEGLTRTPASESKDNRSVETREFFLAESGPARVVETSTPTGGFENALRRSFRGLDRKMLEENVTEYGRNYYLAEGKPRFEFSSPDDLTTPFRVRIEIDKAGRGATDDTSAAVAILPVELFSELPFSFVSGPDEEEEPTPPSKPRKPRRSDLVFSNPYRAELRYRIVPPPGFSPASIPEDRDDAVGSGRLQTKYSVQESGEVHAELTFDSGPRRITAAQAEAMRDAVRQLRKSEPILIRFEQKGMANLQAGRIREALIEFRALAAQHPKEGLHASQIGQALLAGGLGGAAAREARRAVALEPKSAAAHRTLGWILQHDSLGRRFGNGYDRSAAIAAYRKAVELDPEDAIARADLAILLEHDSQGRRYVGDSDLDGAIQEYRTLIEKKKEGAYESNLLAALMWDRRWEELAAAARDMKASTLRNQYLLFAAAAGGGAAEGRKEAARLFPEAAPRREALTLVATSLAQARLYPTAADLLETAAAGAPNAMELRARAELFRALRPYTEVQPGPDAPESAFVELLIRVIRSPKDIGSLEGLVSRAASQLKTESGSSLEAFRAARRAMTQPGVSPEFTLDLVMSNVLFSTEGSERTGWRVRYRGKGLMTQVDGTAFVVKEDGRMRLLAMEQVLAPMGIEALERSEKGDLDGARTLLDWTREILTPAGGDDPFSGAAFPRLWPPADKADAAAARAAAASLMIHPSVAARSIAALRPARDEALGERRLHLEWALAMACVSAKDWPCTRESASALTAAHPDSEAAFSLYQLALWSLEEVKAAAEHAEARLARKAGDASATRSLSSLAASAGRFDEADRLLRGLADRGSATPGDFNNLAWYALFRPPVGEPAFEDARRAVEAQKRQNSFSLHTLACLEAEVGRTAEARNALLQSIEMAGRDDPASYDWYVIGRLCEHYGELDSAADAYRRISRPEPREAAYSTWELARRRLEGLPKSARPPATSPRPRAGA